VLGFYTEEIRRAINFIYQRQNITILACLSGEASFFGKFFLIDVKVSANVFG
jgi:hypothetical protein